MKFTGLFAMLILAAWASITLLPASTEGKSDEKSAKRLVIRVSDHSAVGDGKTDDGPAIRKAIAKALDAGRPATVLFDKKTYYIGERPDRWESFELIDARDVIIDGGGAKLIFSPNSRGFLLKRAANCIVRNFEIDFAPLPFTQGDIVSVSSEKGYFDVRLHDGYPDPPDQEWMDRNYGGNWRHGCVMEPSTRAFSTRLEGGFIIPESIHNMDSHSRTYRVTSADEERLKQVATGDRFVFRVYTAAKERRDRLEGLPVATFRITESSDCVISNIRQYCSPEMWIHLQENIGRITIDGCSITYKPGDTRLVTALSDGIHCKSNRVGPVIQNCFFEGLMDDSINIGRMEDAVIEVRSDTVFRVACQDIVWFDGSIKVGDEMLAFDRGRGKILGRAKVIEVSEEERRVRTIHLDKPIKEVRPITGPDDRHYTCFYNLSSCGNGYIIRNNIFLAQMRNAMLLRASGTIEENYIDNVGGFAVYLTNDPPYREGPVPDGVVIRRNRVVNCKHNGAFLISCGGSTAQIDRLVRNILIEENQIHVEADYPAIQLTNARDITIRSNTFSISPRVRNAVEIINCEGISCRGNVTNGKANEACSLNNNYSASRRNRELPAH